MKGSLGVTYPPHIPAQVGEWVGGWLEPHGGWADAFKDARAHWCMDTWIRGCMDECFDNFIGVLVDECLDVLMDWQMSGFIQE